MPFVPIRKIKSPRNPFFTNNKRWQVALFILGTLVLMSGLLHTHILIRKISEDERSKIRTWAQATQHKAKFVQSMQLYFHEVQEQEREKVKLFAKIQTDRETYGKYYKKELYDLFVVEDNTIPIIITNKAGKYISSKNVTFDSVLLTPLGLDDYLYENFSKYPPIPINIKQNSPHYIYYQDSRIFRDIKKTYIDIINSFFNDVTKNSLSVPVIITDSSKKKILTYGNIEDDILQNKHLLYEMLRNMLSQNEPIKINLLNQGTQYIFYKDSPILARLKRFPYVQVSVVSLFFIITYLIVMASKKNEQNKLWVGLAKETAHQLGTPMSSLMAWADYLDSKNTSGEIMVEIRKDIDRLNKITERFSKIGSIPKLVEDDLTETIYNSVDYIKKRLSSRIPVIINIEKEQTFRAPLNKPLFEWVIENLIKNAIDAMTQEGRVNIFVFDMGKYIAIDVSDTGKGIARSAYHAVFRPGFSTKVRGWGLGLSLSKRIIEEYHGGKLYIKSSTPGKGTTFRIELNKEHKH